MKRVDFDASVANHNLNNKQFIVRRKTKIENKEAKDMKNIETRVDVRIECLLLLLIFLLFNQTRTTFYSYLTFETRCHESTRKSMILATFVSWIIYAVHKSISSHLRGVCQLTTAGMSLVNCLISQRVWRPRLSGTWG